MLETFLTSSESDQYSSTPKEISKFPLMYMTGYFCMSVYKHTDYGHCLQTNPYEQHSSSVLHRYIHLTLTLKSLYMNKLKGDDEVANHVRFTC